MDRDLVYRISAAGAAAAIREIGSVHEAIRRMDQQEVTLANAVSAAKVSAAKKGAEGKKKAADDGAQHESMMSKLSVTIEKQRAKDIVKAAQDAEKQRVGIVKQTMKEAEKASAEKVKSFERSEKEMTKIAAREAKARAEIEKAVGKAQQASAARQLQQNSQHFRQMERASQRDERDKMFDRKRLFRGVATGAVNWGFGAAQGAASAIGGAARMGLRGARSVAGALGLNDATDVGDIFAQRMKLQQRIRYINMEAGGGINEAAAYQGVRGAASLTGISQGDIGGALDVYSEKGQGAMGLASINQTAKEAKAYNADIKDIATLRAQAKISAEQAGENLSEEDLSNMVAKMAALGKRGTMRISDLAANSPKLFSSWAAGGQSMKGGLDEMIGFTELVRSSSSGGKNTATTMATLQKDVRSKEAKINALLGPDAVYDKEGRQRDPLQVALRVLAKTGGRGTIYNKIFNKKSDEALNPFRSAMQGHKTEAGRLKAMRRALKEAGETSGIDAKTTESDFAGATDTLESKMSVAKEKIRQSLEDALLPAFQKLAASMPDIIKAIETAISKISPMLQALGKSLMEIWKTVGPILMPIAGKAFGYAADHPLQAIALGGVARTALGGAAGGARSLLGAGARFLGDRLAGGMGGGIAGKLAGGLLGAGGAAVASAGSTPVYITGAAAGVFGSGGGGGIPGIGGGGAGGIAALGPIAAFAAAGIVTYLVADYMSSHPTSTNQGVGVDDHARVTKSDALYKGGMDEIREARQKRDTGMFAMWNGKEDPDEVKKKQASAYKYFPEVAAKVAAGEMTAAEATAAASGSLKPGGINLKVGAGGMFESGPTAKNAEELATAFASIAKQAKDAAAQLGDLSNKAGSAGANVSKIGGGGVPGAGGT